MPLVDGIQTAGTLGRATHLGEPLTCDQIRELPDRAEVVITWCGGNGPHPYLILVDTSGQRRAEGPNNDVILSMDAWEALRGGGQQIPFHRVTLGWDDATRAWHETKIPLPDHLLESQEILRGVPQPEWTFEQMRVADVLEDVDDRLVKLPWTTWRDPSTVVKREDLFVAANEAAKAAFGEDTVPEPYPGGPTKRWAVLLTEEGMAAAAAADKAVAAVLLDVDKRLAAIGYTMPGGIPTVDRDLIFSPVDQAAEAALGQHWRRAMRKARGRR